MTIDYEKVMLSAARRGCSPFTEMKRLLKYTPAKDNQQRCKNCKNINIMYNNRYQCRVIGEGYELAADIDIDYTCDNWQK